MYGCVRDVGMTAVVSVAVVAAAPMVRERARDKITVFFMMYFFDYYYYCCMEARR